MSGINLRSRYQHSPWASYCRDDPPGLQAHRRAPCRKVLKAPTITFAWAIAGIFIALVKWVHAAEPAATVGPPVVVTATRVNEPPQHYPAGTRVITARDIGRSGATSLSQLLQSLPDIRTRELPGSPNPQIDMRGFGGFGDQNTLVLLDGMRIREYEQLTVNWSAIPIESIERIEILPAGSAVLYGGGTAGGAVNIITKAPQRNSRSLQASAGIGSHNTRELRISARAAGDQTGMRMHGSHYESDNYRDNNRVRIDNVQADVRWTGDASSVTLKFGADEQYNGLPGILSEAQIAVNRRRAATPNDSGRQHGAYLGLTAQRRISDAEFDLNLGYRERDTSSSFFVGTPLRNTVDTRVRVWTLAPRLRLSPRLGSWDNRFVAGIELEDWTFDGNSQPAILGRPHSTQRSTALYVQHSMHFASRTELSLGVRRQHASYSVSDLAAPAANGARQHTLFAWDFSVRQALAPTLHVYARRSNHFRLPNVNDNYNPFFARVTLLEPQTARDTEIGLDGTRGPLRYRAAVYRINLDNEIFFDPVTLGSRNRQPTRRQGLQLETRWQASSSLDIYANYTYADARFREGSVGGASIAGKQVPLTPRHTLSAGLGWSLPGGSRAGFDVRHTSNSIFDADERNVFGREIPAYTVADLRLSLRHEGWLLNGGVRNLFNRKYFIHGVFTGFSTYVALPAAERTVFVSAQYGF